MAVGPEAPTPPCAQWFAPRCLGELTLPSAEPIVSRSFQGRLGAPVRLLFLPPDTSGF